MKSKKLNIFFITLGIVLIAYFISAQTQESPQKQDNATTVPEEEHITYLGLKLPPELTGHKVIKQDTNYLQKRLKEILELTQNQ